MTLCLGTARRGQGGSRHSRWLFIKDIWIAVFLLSQRHCNCPVTTDFGIIIHTESCQTDAKLAGVLICTSCSSQGAKQQHQTLPAGLGIATEGDDVLLQERTGPSALPGAATFLRVLQRRDWGREDGVGLERGR